MMAEEDGDLPVENDLTLAACLAYYNVQLEHVIRMGNYITNSMDKNEITDRPEKHSEKYPRKSTKHIYKRAKDFRPTKTQDLFEYVAHIHKKGEKKLNLIGEYMTTDMDIKSRLVNNAIDEFETKLEDYLDIVCAEKIKYEIDKEFIFLDVVETANRYLYVEGKILLNNIAREVNDTSKVADFQIISKTLRNESFTNIKADMEYVCSNYMVCRCYPSFTDYSKDFISEILEMPGSKFDIVIEVFRKILESHSFFFKTIIRDEDEKKIVQHTDNFLRDTSLVRTFLTDLRAVMTQRYKIVHNSNPIIRARNKAVRILLDIIDKALFNEDEDKLSIDFRNTVNSIRFWVGGQRDDIDKVLSKFTNDIIKTLNFAFTNNTRMEVKTLVEVILRGRTDSGVYNLYMNNFGSKFVRGEDTTPANDI